MKNIYFTKTMIQNYNKVGALPPLIDGRYYGKQHLVYLYYINLLKSDFLLKDIKYTMDNLYCDGDVLELHEKILTLQSFASQYRKEYLQKIKTLSANDHEQNLLVMLEITSIKNENL